MNISAYLTLLQLGAYAAIAAAVMSAVTLILVSWVLIISARIASRQGEDGGGPGPRTEIIPPVWASSRKDKKAA